MLTRDADELNANINGSAITIPANDDPIIWGDKYFLNKGRDCDIAKTPIPSTPRASLRYVDGSAPPKHTIVSYT